MKVILSGQVPTTNLWNQISQAISAQAITDEITRAKIRFKQTDGQSKSVDIDPITGTPLSQSYIRSIIHRNITPFMSLSSEKVVPHFADLIEGDLVANR